MSRFYCDKEGEIIEAFRRGALDSELVQHAARCALCADTLEVATFLLAERTAAPLMPDSEFLWWKGQLASKQMAVERATRSITLVRKVSYLGLVATGLWLVFAPGHLESAMATLLKHETWPAGALNQSALFLGVGALAFTLLGSWYLVRSEK